MTDKDFIKEILMELCDRLSPKGGKPLDRGQAICETAKLIIELHEENKLLKFGIKDKMDQKTLQENV